jgi:hypothetical protein
MLPSRRRFIVLRAKHRHRKFDQTPMQQANRRGRSGVATLNKRVQGVVGSHRTKEGRKEMSRVVGQETGARKEPLSRELQSRRRAKKGAQGENY